VTNTQKIKMQIIMNLGCDENEAYTALINNAWDTIDTERAILGRTATRPMQADENCGYTDRLAGYYDKWYRYNRIDDGAAYDRGCVKAVNSGKCPENFTLIEA